MRILHAALTTALALAATAAFAQPPASDAPGDRIESFPAIDRVSAEQAALRSAMHCVAERSFCLRAWREGDGGVWTLDIHDRAPLGANVAPARRFALPAGDNPDRETFNIWPHLVREASGALLIGVERYRTEGFSGGGAGETRLVLLRLESGAAEPVEVLTVQTGYSAMIRACFTEEEYRHRGACHDEYELVGTLGLTPAAAPGRPRLVLTTAARSFPRGARAEGENERARIPRRDLVWERDPACSYRRSFAFDAASGRYLPDRPLPDCSTYALP